MITDPLEDAVKRFTCDELGVGYEQLTTSTRLTHDLGVAGDDGWEFMKSFGQRFGVDSRNFDCDRHFGKEAGCNPFAYLFMLVFLPQYLRPPPITLGDLVDAARTRRWRTLDRKAV